MDKLNKDELFLIALHLDLPDLLNFGDMNKKIRNFFSRDTIWLHKLKEYPDFRIPGSYKHNYIVTYALDRLKGEFNLAGSLTELYNLDTLDLSYSYLAYIPQEIFLMVNLKNLYMRDGEIRVIPKEIGNLVNLESLDLADNEIETLPDELGRLKKLNCLDLSHNVLSEIPTFIGELESLEDLYLTDNNIHQISPNIIIKLEKLVHLDLDDNKLKKIDVTNMTRLRSLDLRFNNLEEIPDGVTKLTHLQKLDLRDNPNLKIPRSLHDYLNDMDGLWMDYSQIIK